MTCRLGLVADIQYADLDDRSNREYRQSIAKFLAACGDLRDRGIDRLIQLGDAVDRGWSNTTTMLELFEICGLEMIHVLGNHDYNIEDSRKKELPKRWNIPDCGYYSRVFANTNDASNRWRLIVLNGVEISPVASANDEERARAEELRSHYAQILGKAPEVWTGAVSQTQLEWFEAELHAATATNENVVVATHFPLFAQGGSFAEKRGLSIGKGFLNSIPIHYHLMGVSTWNGEELLAIVERFACVRAWFAGHNHEGSYGILHGVHHLTFQAMVEGKPNAYSIVSLNADSIQVEGFGSEPSRKLTW